MLIKNNEDLKYKCSSNHINIFNKESLKKLFEKNYIVINCKECGENITILKTDIFKKENTE